MNLFKINGQTTAVETVPLISETPIGNLIFDALFNEKSLLNFKPRSTYLIDNKSIISTWLFDECQIEFLKLNIIPNIPSRMKVAQCLSGLWRIKIFKGKPIFNFKCSLDYTGPNRLHDLDVSIESGESLAALTWESPAIRLTIGTEDKEFLQQRASNENLLPYRFKDLIDDECIEYLKNGINVVLPNFEENDKAQIPFTIAWSYREIATWFAVDERASDILKQADVE